MSVSLQNQPPANGASEDGLKTWSCVICRRRKVKCDRRDPCSNCTRANIDCHYPVTGRLPRRRQNPGIAKSQAQKQTELLSRLRRLETVVTELAGQVEDGSREPHIGLATALSVSGSTPGSDVAHSDSKSVDQSMKSSSSEVSRPAPPPGSEFYEDFGRLVIDKDGGLHIGNQFWTIFCSEVDHIFEAMHDMTEDNQSHEPTKASTSNASLGHQGFMFGSTTNIDTLYPLPSQMLFIWQTFVDNVDPFIKILHIPSMEKIIRDLKGNFSSLSPNLRPLLFCTCLAAIHSMDDQSVVMNFNVPKAQLLAQYRFGAEQALSQANFLATTDIVVVQAFTIYLAMLFSLGANDMAWPLIGVLLRIAKSLKLHRKENERDYNQLEIELRRRLWWHICFLDTISQKPDTKDLSLSEASFNVDEPSGLDDKDLDAASLNPARTDKVVTCMLPSLIRIELWRLVQTLQTHVASSQEVKLQICYATKSKVYTKYLNHPCTNDSLDNYVRTMASLFFAKAELVLHRSSPANPESSIQAALKASIIIINAAHALIMEPGWVNWRWHLTGHIPWHAIGIFLRQALQQPWGPESEQMWISIKGLVDSAPADAKQDRLWEPLLQLMKQAENHRAAEMANWGTGKPQNQAPTGVSNPRQSTMNATYNSATIMSYPTNEMQQMEIKSQPYNSGAISLQEPGISGTRVDFGAPSNLPEYSTIDLGSKSADPTWWSPVTQPEHLRQVETSEQAALPDGDFLMVLDSWDEAAAVGSIWDML